MLRLALSLQINSNSNQSTLGLVNLTEKLSLFPCSEGRPYDVYTRATMPRRYHFSKNERIGDIVLESKLGQKIYKFLIFPKLMPIKICLHPIQTIPISALIFLQEITKRAMTK